jgi:N-acetylneuraminate synthase/sialic acid synthase
MKRELTIAGRRIADDTDCFVIAEIGHNHQGNLATAKKMFEAAAECGVDAVKLQKRDNRTLYTRSMYEKPYDNENSFGATYGAHREALEFGQGEYEELQACAKELDLVFMATAFDEPSADFLERLDMPAYKIASGDLRNTPLLQHVAAFGKPMIISTGAAQMEDVLRARDAIMPINPRLAILQCTAAYPADFDQLDLRVIESYRAAFPSLVIGLSGHDNSISVAVAAYVLGGRILEKHFTLNRAMKGTDHAFSLEPVGMRKLVRDLQRTRVALGDAVKKTYPTEKSALAKMGKTLVAARALPVGHVVTEADVSARSPGDGLAPHEIGRVLGRRLCRPLGEHEAYTLDALDAGPTARPPAPDPSGRPTSPA